MAGSPATYVAQQQNETTTNSDIVAAHTDPLSGVPGDMHDHGGLRFTHMTGSPATHVAQQQTPMHTHGDEDHHT